MRPLLVVLLGCTLANSVGAQPLASSSACDNGRCPIGPAPPASDRASGVPAANLQVDARAIARITNDRGATRSAGTGTLVDVDAERGLIVTCAHLFREGVGTLSVTFPNQQPFAARLEKIDVGADLAALSIKVPSIEPIAIAETFPRQGDPLVSCGYAGDGQLWCNRGQALGYVTTAGGQGLETLELSGAARFGDSGGPVFDRNHDLVAVLFGTNGRVVDGTYCGRIRRFLANLSPQCRPRQPAAASVAPPPVPGPVAPSWPSQLTPPPAGPAALPDQLANLEQLVSRINQGWQALSAKLDALASAAAQTRQAAGAGGGSSSDSRQSSPLQPPKLELPSGMNSAGQSADLLEAVAEPWSSARLAALLVSLGVPGGVAGVAAGAAVWPVMRRAKQRLQTELDRLHAGGAGPPSASQSVDAATSVDPTVVERHHNQYVGYEVTALDKAWAAAHAHVGEKYPGAVPYLKLVEGVKDQLLSGISDPQLS